MMFPTAVVHQTTAKSKNGKRRFNRSGKGKRNATQASPSKATEKPSSNAAIVVPPKTIVASLVPQPAPATVLETVPDAASRKHNEAATFNAHKSIISKKTAFAAAFVAAQAASPVSTEARAYDSKLSSVGSTPAKAQMSIAKPKGVSFMDLAPEIRNQVYELATDDRRVHIKRGHRASRKTGDTTELIHESLDPDIQAIKKTEVLKVEGPMAFPLGLLRANRKINREVTTVLYAKTSFVFHSIKALRFFLNRVPSLAKESIRNLEIRHIQYAHPLLTENRWAKEKSDFQFYMVCERAANDLKSLRHLKIELTINDRPVQLKLEADWAIPLMFFAGKCLVKTQAKLSCSSYGSDLVTACAKILEKELLSADAKKAWYVTEEKKAVAKAKRLMREERHRSIRAKKSIRISSASTTSPSNDQGSSTCGFPTAQAC